MCGADECECGDESDETTHGRGVHVGEHRGGDYTSHMHANIRHDVGIIHTADTHKATHKAHTHTHTVTHTHTHVHIHTYNPHTLHAHAWSVFVCM